MPDRNKPLFCLPLGLDNVLWGNALAARPASNLARHEASSLVWRSKGNSDLWVSGEFADGSNEIDFVALLGTNAQAGTTARLSLGASFDDAASAGLGDTGAQQIISPVPAVPREDGTSHWLFEFGSAVDATNWRLEIAGHTGDFQAAALVIGKKIVPSRFYNLNYEFGAQDLGSLDIGRWGVLENSGGLVKETVDFALGWQNEAEFELNFRPMMRRLGQRGMVYCCFDPAASVYREARTYFGVLRQPLVARGIRKPRTYLQEFSILSLY